jgi:hypothetical protein
MLSVTSAPLANALQRVPPSLAKRVASSVVSPERILPDCVRIFGQGDHTVYVSVLSPQVCPPGKYALKIGHTSHLEKYWRPIDGDVQKYMRVTPPALEQQPAVVLRSWAWHSHRHAQADPPRSAARWLLTLLPPQRASSHDARVYRTVRR